VKRFIGFLLFIIALSSCSSTPVRPVGALKLSNSILNVGVPYIPNNLNPNNSISGWNIASSVMQLVLPQSYYIDQNDSPKLVSWFLNQVELVSINPETLVYTINPDVKWSNGQRIGISDYLNQWKTCSELNDEALLKNSEPPCSPGYNLISSITGTNSSIKVEFSSYFADWESLFNNIIPPVVNASNFFNAFSYNGPALKFSAGPFRVASFTQNEISIKRNSGYSGPPAGSAQINFIQIPDFNQDAPLYLTASKVNFVMFEPSDMQVLNTLENSKIISYSLGQSNSVLNLVFNPLEGNLTDPNLRAALADMIDRNQLLADTVGLYDPSASIAENHFLTSQNGDFTSNGTPYDSPNQSGYQKILTALGYQYASDGYYQDIHGQILTFSLAYYNDPLGQMVAEELQGELKNAGVSLTLNPQNSLENLANVINSQFQLALVPVLYPTFGSYGYYLFCLNNLSPSLLSETSQSTTTTSTSTSVTPAAGSTTSLCSQAPGYHANLLPNYLSEFNPYAGLSINLNFSNDSAVTSDYLNGVTSLDEVTRQDFYQSADKELWSDMYELPLFGLPVVMAWQYNLKGVISDFYDSGPLINAANWHLIKQKPAQNTKNRG
jgi:ABC-type transport system substrate-binding protein